MDIKVHRSILYALILKMKAFVKKCTSKLQDENHTLRYGSNILACICPTSPGKEISYGSVTCVGILSKVYIKVSLDVVIEISIIYFRCLIGTNYYLLLLRFLEWKHFFKLVKENVYTIFELEFRSMSIYRIEFRLPWNCFQCGSCSCYCYRKLEWLQLYRENPQMQRP